MPKTTPIKPTVPHSSKKAAFIGLPKVSRLTEDEFYRIGSSPKKSPSPKGKKIDDKHVNPNWDKNDYMDDHFELLTLAEIQERKRKSDVEEDSYSYNDSYTESNDENNYESFSRG